ncbi:MAG TPA: M28 family peptidase [Gemmatimonadales bacterium]|nr:M28 family peptidase [Gemmatimonadales bacterium]
MISRNTVRAFCLAGTVAILAACHASTERRPEVAAAAVPASLQLDVEYLSDDALEGRGTGSAGNDSAAVYIARRFAALGLEPAGGVPAASACTAASATSCPEAYLQRFTARPASDAHRGITEGRRTQNVVAILRGTDPELRDQVVVLGAHFDHLGRSPESSLDPQAGDAIRNGADDNASGTAVVMELARVLSANPPRRSVLFVLFSGEELGLLGSLHFVDNLPVPMERVQAMVNFDMVGRLRDDRLIVYGIGTAEEMPALVQQANSAEAPLSLATVPDGFGPSDHSSFYAKGIPVLHMFTDLHEQYHRATDKANTINYAGLQRVADYATRVTRELANRDGRLTPIRTAPPSVAAGSSSSGSSAYFGSVPDMAATEGVVGMRLTGVTPGSPADKAGIQAGDVIVQFGGVAVKDIYEYTDALRSHAPGDVVEIVAVRNGKRMTFSATLTTRGG